MNAARELWKALDDAAQGIVPPDLKAKGWRYQDFPTKFTPEAWEHLLAWIGGGEYQIIVGSSGMDKEGKPWVRGQLFVSPQGYDNLRDKERGRRLKATHAATRAD